jgi:hypothetical protein
MQPPEVRREFQKYERKLDRELRRDKRKLFEALEEFANIRPEEWSYFRKRRPAFFPEEEYDRVAKGLKPSIADYPFCLDRLWIGTDSPLAIMLGIDATPLVEELLPEDMWLAGVASIQAQFDVDWEEGVFRYRGVCDFQRALYLLFRESWRARLCDRCDAKFIARRAAQKYCTTDCSELMQRELKRKWWAAHGEAWRTQRRNLQRKRKGGSHGTKKAR